MIGVHMMKPPLKAVQQAVAYLSDYREEHKNKRNFIRDWEEAHREEAERRATAREELERQERPQLLESVHELTGQLLDRYNQLGPVLDHRYIGYFGPANDYLYLRPNGTYQFGAHGEKVLFPHQYDNSSLRKLIVVLLESVNELDRRLAQEEADVKSST